MGRAERRPRGCDPKRLLTAEWERSGQPGSSEERGPGGLQTTVVAPHFVTAPPSLLQAPRPRTPTPWASGRRRLSGPCAGNGRSVGRTRVTLGPGRPSHRRILSFASVLGRLRGPGPRELGDRSRWGPAPAPQRPGRVSAGRSALRGPRSRRVRREVAQGPRGPPGQPDFAFPVPRRPRAVLQTPPRAGSPPAAQTPEEAPEDPAAARCACAAWSAGVPPEGDAGTGRDAGY